MDRCEIDRSLGLSAIPGRILLDTCVLNRIYEDGGYIFDAEPSLYDDIESYALKMIFLCNNRAFFQFFVSPLTIAEIVNNQRINRIMGQLSWTLEVLDIWLIMLDESGDRSRDGGTVRHRFKLDAKSQDLERVLMSQVDFRRDPVDRLLVVQSLMVNCDALITTDEKTIWRHRDFLWSNGIRILKPSEYWEILRPWSALWL